MGHASKDRGVLSGKKPGRGARTGVETKAGSSSCKGIDRLGVAVRATPSGGLSHHAADSIYNSSVQTNIPLRHPGTLPQYGRKGHITKSAEDRSYPGEDNRLCSRLHA